MSYTLMSLKNLHILLAVITRHFLNKLCSWRYRHIGNATESCCSNRIGYADVTVTVVQRQREASVTKSKELYCHGPLLFYLNDNELPHKTVFMNGKFFSRFDKQ